MAEVVMSGSGGGGGSSDGNRGGESGKSKFDLDRLKPT
jgi:hypothetical protein